MAAFRLRVWLGMMASSSAVIACGSDAVQSVVAERRAAIEPGQLDDDDTGIVRVLLNSATSIGSGTLIAPNVVLTAQHCVAPNHSACGTPFHGVFAAAQTSTLSVTTGTSPATELRLPAVREVRVPAPVGSCSADIAIVILTANVDASVKIYPVRLEPGPSRGETYAAVGFGRTCETCSPGTRYRRDSQSVLATESWTIDGGSTQWDTTLVSGEQFGGSPGVCHGDSGGPALDTQGRVFGVLDQALNESSTDCGIASVYIRPDAFKDWIVQTMFDAATLGAYDAPVWAGGPAAGAEGDSGRATGDASDEGGASGGVTGTSTGGGEGSTKDDTSTNSDASGTNGGCSVARSRGSEAAWLIWIGSVLCARLLRRRTREGALS
jgi:hypothetical protein